MCVCVCTHAHAHAGGLLSALVLKFSRMMAEVDVEQVPTS